MTQSSIETIKEIKVHPNADKLELAVVKGWQVVVQKGQFLPGDKAVYIEIDSLIKRAPWNEFLFKDSDKQEYRLRTVRLRSEISQGILFSTDILTGKGVSVLYDLDELLGIIKYEKPIPRQPGANGGSIAEAGFPTHLISKTDEERCLIGDTLIMTDEGVQSIKNICETYYSGKVLSYNILTMELQFQNILNWSVQDNLDDWFQIELENGEIIVATKNHKVFSNEKYTQVQNLKVGDYLYVYEL